MQAPKRVAPTSPDMEMGDGMAFKSTDRLEDLNNTWTLKTES